MAAVALSYLIDPHTPKNDGTFRPLEVIAKPGTIVWANEGAPVTLATNHCGQCSQSCPAGNQEHNQELVFHGVYRFDAGKDLTGHHSR